MYVRHTDGVVGHFRASNPSRRTRYQVPGRFQKVFPWEDRRTHVRTHGRRGGREEVEPQKKVSKINLVPSTWYLPIGPTPVFRFGGARRGRAAARR